MEGGDSEPEDLDRPVEDTKKKKKHKHKKHKNKRKERKEPALSPQIQPHINLAAANASAERR